MLNRLDITYDVSVCTFNRSPPYVIYHLEERVFIFTIAKHTPSNAKPIHNT